MMHPFLECKEVAEYKEFVGCKIVRKEKLKHLQPVIIQSLEDEFSIKPDSKLQTPASCGKIFLPVESDDQMSLEK
jgi:hypothetical protein